MAVFKNIFTLFFGFSDRMARCAGSQAGRKEIGFN
jgi:hypothetical protein